MRIARVFSLLIVTIGTACFAAQSASAALETRAEHAVLMDGESGQVLWAKDATTPSPPASMSKLMSALDLAKLARHLITGYPQYYHYFAERSFSMDVGNGRKITQPNRDSVLDKFPGTDGLKTGHTDAAGYGITVSAVQSGHRLILVLNGLRYPQLDKMTPAAQDWHGVQLRGDEAARLLGIAFREFKRYPLFKPDDGVAQAEVWQGAKDTVPL